MIKLRKGNTRWAFIFFRLFVVKVPNPRLDWIRQDYEIHGVWKCLLRSPKNLYKAFVFGVVANVTEALVSAYTKVAFISPVYTIAFANFQRYEGEATPTQQEVADFFLGHGLGLYDPEYDHSAHASGYYNWRKTPRGLVLIDYAVDPLRDNLIRLIKKLDRRIKREKTKKGPG